MVKQGGKREVTNEKILEVVLDMNEQMVTKTDLADALKGYATKNDLEKFKEDILEEIRPIAKAVDMDAETIVKHEKRITFLERKAGIHTR